MPHSEGFITTRYIMGMTNAVEQDSWTEIAVTVATKDIDVAGDIANMTVPYGIYIEDYRTLEQEAWEIAGIDHLSLFPSKYKLV